MKQEIWSRILAALQENINEQSFKTFFATTNLDSIEDRTLNVSVQNEIAAEYLNKNYAQMISEITAVLFEKPYNISFFYQKQAPVDLSQNSPQKAKTPKLNPKYKFEEFVIGKSNNFAHSAAIAVAESLGNMYNPLFIYGESGMGKTHLMQAIGHYVWEDDPSKSVTYTTTEAFMNEMIEAIQKNTMPKFRNKYRSVNLLLIDDIHFLAKKEGTQEEFFHTFNALKDNKQQIVLTSDRPPKDISDLEKRLVTRFEQGLLADLKAPNFETRAAILKKKAESEGIILSNAVIDFVAEHVHNNVRVLEGALTRLVAFASINQMHTADLTAKQAKDILKHLISSEKSELTLDTVLTMVCKTYSLSPEKLLDSTKKRNIAFPRQVGMYLATRLMPQLSLKEVANFFKRKDHTTVKYAKEKLEEKYKSDHEFRSTIDDMVKELKSDL